MRNAGLEQVQITYNAERQKQEIIQVLEQKLWVKHKVGDTQISGEKLGDTQISGEKLGDTQISGEKIGDTHFRRETRRHTDFRRETRRHIFQERK